MDSNDFNIGVGFQDFQSIRLVSFRQHNSVDFFYKVVAKNIQVLRQFEIVVLQKTI